MERSTSRLGFFMFLATGMTNSTPMKSQKASAAIAMTLPVPVTAGAD